MRSVTIVAMIAGAVAEVVQVVEVSQVDGVGFLAATSARRIAGGTIDAVASARIADAGDGTEAGRALHRRGANAGARLALIGLRARVVVVASGTIHQRRMAAGAGTVALVAGALVAIVGARRAVGQRRVAAGAEPVALIAGTFVTVVRARQAARHGRVSATASAVALVVGANRAVVAASRGEAGIALRAYIVARCVAFEERARIAVVEAAGATEAGVGAVAEHAVVAGNEEIVDVPAHPESVANVIGAHVALIGTRRPVRGCATVGRFRTGVVALRATAARIAAVHRARTAQAGVRTVTEEQIVARRGVGRRRTAVRAAVGVVQIAVVARFAGGDDPLPQADGAVRITAVAVDEVPCRRRLPRLRSCAVAADRRRRAKSRWFRIARVGDRAEQCAARRIVHIHSVASDRRPGAGAIQRQLVHAAVRAGGRDRNTPSGVAPHGAGGGIEAENFDGPQAAHIELVVRHC